jgi:hypothetical protein
LKLSSYGGWLSSKSGFVSLLSLVGRVQFHEYRVGMPYFWSLILRTGNKEGKQMDAKRIMKLDLQIPGYEALYKVLHFMRKKPYFFIIISVRH